jgi:glycosyltransferase involved in cell wall biosynthesis
MISIITPVLNGEKYIEGAIRSVLSQGYPDFEHIVVDGGSSDGTATILKRFSHLKIITEPDNNMYFALNKGLQDASGDVIGFLNSDDCYAPGVFSTISQIFSADENLDFIWAAANLIRTSRNQNETIDTYFPIEGDDALIRLMVDPPIMNACFFHRRLFEKYGTFWTNLKISADREFMIRLNLKQVKTYYLETLVYNYRAHEKSLTMGDQTGLEERLSKEHCLIAEAYIQAHENAPAVLSAFTWWHSDRCIFLSARSMKNGDFQSSYRYLRRAAQYNPRWFQVFLKKLVSQGRKALLPGNR